VDGRERKMEGEGTKEGRGGRVHNKEETKRVEKRRGGRIGAEEGAPVEEENPEEPSSQSEKPNY